MLGARGVEQREQARDADRLGVLPVTRTVLVLLVVDLLLVSRAGGGLGQLVAGVDAPGR